MKKQEASQLFILAATKADKAVDRGITIDLERKRAGRPGH
jgi:hypothetical protein